MNDVSGRFAAFLDHGDDATTVCADIKIIPDGIYTRADGSMVLRAVLSVTPSDQDGAIVLSRWPNEIAAKLKSLRVFLADIPDTGNPDLTKIVPIHAEAKFDGGHATESLALWKELLAPPHGRSALGETSNAFSQLTELLDADTQLKDRFTQSIRKRTYRWATLKASIQDSANVTRMGVYMPDGAYDASLPPLRISDVPNADLAAAFRTIGAARYLQFLKAHSPTGGQFGALGAHPEIWSGVTSLFLGPPDVGGATRSAADQQVIDSLAVRGVAAATAASDARRKHNASTVFERKPPPPAPETRLTQNMVRLIDTVRSVPARTARTSPGALLSAFAGQTDVTLENQLAQISPRNSAWLNRRVTPTDPAAEALWRLLQLPRQPGGAPAGDLPDFIQQSLVHHLIGLRDDPVKAGGEARLFRLDGTERIFRKADLRSLFTAIDDAMARRLYGVQAYPALSRVLKLAIDVELDPSQVAAAARWTPRGGVNVAAGDGAIVFAMAATLDGAQPSSDSFWIACRLTRKGFVAAGREEVDVAKAMVRNGPAGPLASVLDLADPPTYQGVWNLGATLKDGPRFSITSLDLASRAEQFLNQAKSTSTSSSTSQSAPDPEDHAPARTSGLTLVDSARAADVQKQTDAAVGTRAKSRSDDRILFADDITVGYRLDVAVDPLDAKAPQWRSLMQRRIKFGTTADGTIDVQALVNATLRAAVPGGPMGDVQAFADRLAEASFRTASRVVSTRAQDLPDDLAAAEIISQQNVVEWLADPLGSPCHGGATDAHDALTDLLLDVTMDLPRDKLLPPRQVFGRGYSFGARAMYIGGAGPTLAEAEPVYNHARSGRLTLPHRGERGEPFLRQERIAAPKIAAVYRGGGALRDRRGETLTRAVLRSGETAALRTSLVRRMIYAPGVGQAFAALHPDPHARPGCALDHAPVLERRPIGGFVHVDVDPITGGLRVQRYDGSISDPKRLKNGKPVKLQKEDLKRAPDEGVFRVTEVNTRQIAARKGHYYPDPVTDAVMVELWTTGAAPRKIGGTVAVPIYDPDYSQTVPGGLVNESTVACQYPFAMPVLLEVRALPWDKSSRLAFDATDDTGVLDEDGDFQWLQKGDEPPESSVTVRRVTAYVRAGESLRIKTWCRTPSRALKLFANYRHAIDVFKFLASRQPNNATQLNQAAKVVLGVDIQRLTNNKLVPDDTQVLDALDSLLSNRPHPEQSEALEIDLIHAAQRPQGPRWVCGHGVDADCVAGVGPESVTGLAVLRRTTTDPAAWATWLKDPGHRDLKQWPINHMATATTATFGGGLAVDLAAADSVQLEVRFRDFRDEGGNVLPYHDGVFTFPLQGPLVTSATLDEQDRRQPDYDASKLGQYDLLVARGGGPRNLTVHLPDSRAYRLEVTPTTGSAYVKYLDAGPDKAPRRPYSSGGVVETVWADATARPSPMGHVSLLPVFVWEERTGGGTRTTRMRLSWRRPQAEVAAKTSTRVPNAGWFSSGEDERLGLVFAPKTPDPSFGLATSYQSQWGGDAIRTGTPPPTGGLRTAISVRSLPKENGKAPDSWVTDQWMPLPGEQDRGSIYKGGAKQDAAQKDIATLVDLLTLEPEYDPKQDLWYADVEINPDNTAGPWVRLGLVRYQPHAISNGTAVGDMHVSQPNRVEFRLEPKRILDIVAGRRDEDTGLWPVTVTVRGPNSFVAGGRGRQSRVADEAALASISRPRFKLSVLRRPTPIFDVFDQPGGDITVAEATSDGDPPPTGDLLWHTTIFLRSNPTGSSHFVFIEEVDAMLPANPEGYAPGQLIESGPRFMAKVRIERA